MQQGWVLTCQARDFETQMEQHGNQCAQRTAASQTAPVSEKAVTFGGVSVAIVTNYLLPEYK